MKKKAIALSVSILLLIGTSALADVPSEVTYQGRLLFNGNPVTSATSITFRLFQFSSGGSAVWTETYSVTPKSNGIYTQILGGTSPIPDEYDSLWLELVVAGNTLTPRKKITSSPFVLRAGELPDLYVSGNVGIGTTSPQAPLHLHSTAAVDLPFRMENASRAWVIDVQGGGPLDIIDATAFESRFTIINDGKIGIGTTTPGTHLHLLHSGDTGMKVETTTFYQSASLSITGGATDKSILNFGDASDNNKGRIIYYNSDNYMDFITNSDLANPRMKILANGYVGIGVTPSAKFQVGGDVRVNGDLWYERGSNDCYIVTRSSSCVGGEQQISNTGATGLRLCCYCQ